MLVGERVASRKSRFIYNKAYDEQKEEGLSVVS